MEGIASSYGANYVAKARDDLPSREVRRRRGAPPAPSNDQPELPLKAVPKGRPTVIAPEIAARAAVSRRANSHHRVLAWTKTGRERVSNFLHPVSVDGDWRPVDMGLLARLANVQRMDPEAFLLGGTKPWSSMEVHRLWRRTLAKAQVRYVRRNN